MIRLLVTNMTPDVAEQESRRALGCHAPVATITVYRQGNPNSATALVAMDVSVAVAERLANRANGFVTACGRRLQCHVLPFG